MGSGILLESGTGEVEILEFIVNNKHYGINVIKVKEVLEMEELTEIPQSHPAVAGLILCRNEIITLVNLKYVLDGQSVVNKKNKIILCEFNKTKVAFNIDSIVGIHRIGWNNISKPEDIASNPLIIGNIILNNKIIFLLDFEKIVTDINPESGISEDKIIDVEYRDRSDIKLMLVDDSPLIRRLLRETLTKAGFTNLKSFDEGEQALDYLNKLVREKGEDFIKEVQLVITDIEMPKMDGHTLTRKIKEDNILRELPVIIFSSLITNELAHKGKAVGADAQLSKPEVGTLVGLIDKFIK
ncbi:MAG: chemotaxis protein CheV [Clostridium lundense]|nr:chemotaxis protein CheV [Clostridium lundense]